MIYDASGSFSYTTSHDTATLLNEFINCKYISKEYAKIGIDIMYQQQSNDRISADLLFCDKCNTILGQYNVCPNCGTATWDEDPSEVMFAHKTGEINGTRHDASILNVNGKQIIVVCLCAKLNNYDAGLKAHREIVKIVYNYFK